MGGPRRVWGDGLVRRFLFMFECLFFFNSFSSLSCLLLCFFVFYHFNLFCFFLKFLFLWFFYLTLWFCGCFDGFVLCGLFCLLLLLFFLVDYKKLVAFWSLLHTGLCLVLLWH